MELQHVNVKVFVDGELPVDAERFIEIFHVWTAEQCMDELLIDVADYCHVPAGPGVVLVGQEADYALDHAENRWGLLYNRKAVVDGSNQERFAQAYAAAIKACRKLEDDLSGECALRFDDREFMLIINDRSQVANTPEAHQQLRPEIEAFARGVVGDDFSLQYDDDTRKRFGVRVSASKSPA